MNKKKSSSDSNTPVDVLHKLGSLMSQNEIKLSGDYDNDTDDSLNYDDGDVLNLQHKVSDDTIDEEKKAPDLSSLIQKQMTTLQNNYLPENNKKALDIEEQTEDLSYDLKQNEELDVKDNDEPQEVWQDAIKQELEGFDDHSEEDNEKNEKLSSKESNMDLDRDFGLAEDDEVLLREDIESQPSIENKGEDILNDESELEDDNSDNEMLAGENMDNKILDAKLISADKLISDNVYSETKKMVGKLKKKMDDHNNPSDIGGKDENIEEFMVKIMKPMLKEWLDENLPKLVKNIVQKEIKKLVD